MTCRVTHNCHLRTKKENENCINGNQGGKPRASGAGILTASSTCKGTGTGKGKEGDSEIPDWDSCLFQRKQRGSAQRKIQIEWKKINKFSKREVIFDRGELGIDAQSTTAKGVGGAPMKLPRERAFTFLIQLREDCVLHRKVELTSSTRNPLKSRHVQPSPLRLSEYAPWYFPF